jgi:hypothetical protein
MNPRIKIKANLPFCLYKLDERYFQIDPQTRIRFFREKIEPSRRTSSSENVEFLNDRWGIDGFSRIEIDTEKDIDSSEPMSTKTRTFALEIINKFVSLYRYFDNDAVHLVNLIESDLMDFSIEKDGHASFAIVFGGGITPLNPQQIATVSAKLERALKDGYEIPLWRELVLNAEHYCYIGDFRMAILESVTALELVISQFIGGELSAAGVKDKEIKEFVKETGVAKGLNIMIRFLVGKDGIQDDLLEKCKGAITKRNKIIHEGRRETDYQSTKDSIIAIYKLIQLLLEKGRDMDELRDDYKQIMKFEEYLKTVVPKIGPNAAFDLSRDACITAIENILVDKKVATKEEIEAVVENQLSKSAENILRMSSLPKDDIQNTTKK